MDQGADRLEPPSDPVRAARRLAAEATDACDPGRRLVIAGELRKLGRPDLGLDVVEGLDGDPAAVVERALCLEALGRYGEAREVIGSAARLMPGSADVLLHELRLRQRPGNDGLRSLGSARLRGVLTGAPALRKVAAAVAPWRLSPGALAALLAAAARHAPSRLPGLFVRALAGRSATLLAIVASHLTLAAVRGLCGGRRVYVTSMGKFARLADLVDRIEPLLRRLDAADGRDGHRLFVFIFDGYPNEKLYELYGRRCTFIRSRHRVSQKLARLCVEMLRRAGRHTETTVDYRFNNQDFLHHPPAIGFTREEDRRLRAELKDVGIDPERPFICFGLRDMAYYRFYGDVMQIPLRDQGKRADTHHRCPPLDTYVAFAKYWAERGHQVVRMGLRVSENLPDDLGPMVVDYAAGRRSDALDAALLANCWFLTAGDTGLFSGAAAFDRPTILSDLFLIRNTMYSSNKQTRSIFVPKLIYDEREGRLLSFREQIYCNPVFSYADECEEAGFTIVHNTAEDVIDASIELTERLAGRYEPSREDDDLQRAFHKIYAPSHVGFGSTGLISANFLKKHADLLD